ncbi:uncharacterized protein BX664DRAFT_342818 [Halteromyces radiatus]|uniref:uncharacterized protein n=1 Tax=Halteromyces radiatus TaxID=101107 RepID=UPI002220D115|nr:uncharacterized protein BX664DRAFT_342818 [Halteromyces radiatus]KAI8078830.1 hypothetical protein BX664DRAFT_342818 [Halteromyces radiatus]
MALSALLSELSLRYKGIFDESWYLVAAVVMTTLNQSQDIPILYQHVDNQVDVALRLKDGIFKSVPIIGFPKVINALTQLHTSLPFHVQQQLPSHSQRCMMGRTERRERGEILFNTIYERHATRVKTQLKEAYPDLGQVVLDDAYGTILSDTQYVSALDTSFIVIAALMVQDLPQQLKGHYYGAFHLGASDLQLVHVQSIVQSLSAFYHHTTYCTLPIKK